MFDLNILQQVKDQMNPLLMVFIDQLTNILYNNTKRTTCTFSIPLSTKK